MSAEIININEAPELNDLEGAKVVGFKKESDPVTGQDVFTTYQIPAGDFGDTGITEEVADNKYVNKHNPETEGDIVAYGNLITFKDRSAGQLYCAVGRADNNLVLTSMESIVVFAPSIELTANTIDISGNLIPAANGIDIGNSEYSFNAGYFNILYLRGVAVATKDDIPSVTNGESAYEIAVRNGFAGTEQEWLDSLKAHIPQSSVFKGDLSEIGFNGKFTFGNIIVQIYRQTDTEIRVLFTSTVEEGVNILLQRIDFSDFGIETSKSRRLTISRTGTEVDPVRTGIDRLSALVLQENSGYRIDAISDPSFSDVEVFVSPYNIGVLEAAEIMTPQEIEEVFAGVERGFSVVYRRKIGELL